MFGVNTVLGFVIPPAAVLIIEKVPWCSFLVEMSLLVALWQPAPDLSLGYCNPPPASACVGCGTPLVAMLEISVPKILLIEDVRFAGFALATTLDGPTLNEPDSLGSPPDNIIVALCW